jgi:hypothetical protein
VVNQSLVLSVETRVRHVYAIVAQWVCHKAFRRVLFVLALLRLWQFLRHRRMPQFVAQFLIRWITTASALDQRPSAITRR